MDAVLRCESLDEYIIKKNTFCLFILGVFHYVINYYNWTYPRAFFNFLPIWLFKWGLVIYLIHNIKSSYEKRNSNQVKQKHDGPLTKAIIRSSIGLYSFIESIFKKKKETKSPNQIHLNQSNLLQDNKNTTHLASTLTPSNNIVHRFEPMFQNNNNNNNTMIGTSLTNTIIPSTESLSKEGYAKSSLQRMLEESERLANSTKQQTRFATSLSFSPSIPPPRPPVKRLDKSLWSLYRTDKMVEDFREEQIELFNEHWYMFNDRASKCYYDQLNIWLSGKIFQPLATSINKINQQIKDSNYSLADCPLDAMVMLMFQFNHNMFGLPIRLIHDAIQIPGYDSVKSRQYIIDRVKDLATGNKLAAYRYTPRQDDLPSDALILLHCFKTYLIHEMPSIVPPLIPGEGDIFKFLLVYFYITDDLKDEIFELPIHKK